MKYQLCSFSHELFNPTDPSPPALTLGVLCLIEIVTKRPWAPLRVGRGHTYFLISLTQIFIGLYISGVTDIELSLTREYCLARLNGLQDLTRLSKFLLGSARVCKNMYDSSRFCKI